MCIFDFKCLNLLGTKGETAIKGTNFSSLKRFFADLQMDGGVGLLAV